MLSTGPSIAVYGQRLTKSVTKIGVPEGEVGQRENDQVLVLVSGSGFLVEEERWQA